MDRPVLWLSATESFACYVGTGTSLTRHAHVAVQCVINFDVPMSLDVAGREDRRVDVSLIGSNVPHSGRSAGMVATYWIEPSSTVGRVLDAAATAGGGACEPRLDLSRRAPPRCPAEVRTLLEDVLRSLDPSGSESWPEPSTEIETVMTFLRSTIGERPTLSDAASVARLSTSRLTHRFSAEVGLPFRRYLVWLRLTQAIESLAGGSNLTDAAHASGFSDSSHLSRAFRSTFGVAPRALLATDIRGIDQRSRGSAAATAVGRRRTHG